MKLFKIKQTHYAPKDSETAIKEFVIANNDEEVFNYLAKGYADWGDILDNYGDYDLDEYDEALEIYNEIFENKGDDREVYDLYYGATQYSWEEVSLINENVINLMIENKLAVKI